MQSTVALAGETNDVRGSKCSEQIRAERRETGELGLVVWGGAKKKKEREVRNGKRPKQESDELQRERES